jgi:hypothetical protein
MKKPKSLLLALAALILTSLTNHAFAAATSVTMDLTGKIIKPGGTVLVTATEAIEPAPIYYYSISGSVAAAPATVGNPLFEVTGTGISLVQGLELTDSNLVPYLEGTVLDVGSKASFTAVNKLTKGTYTFTSGPISGDSITGMIRGKAGVTKGTAYGELTNIAFSLTQPAGKHHITLPVPKTDTVEFISGQVVVSVSPITSSTTAKPALAFVTGTGLAGINGLTGAISPASESALLKKGKSKSFEVVLQNSSLVSGSFALTSGSAVNGFSQTFIIGGKNETAKVTGTTPYYSVVLGSGSATTLTWEITDKKAATAGTSTTTLTATSGTNSDSLTLTGTGE